MKYNISDWTEGQKQEKFSSCFALLILFIQSLGYGVRIGDVFANMGHKKNSFHYRKLAADLNVFKPDGTYMTQTIQHEPFGTFWMSLHPKCIWGGDWGDGNHYQFGQDRVD